MNTLLLDVALWDLCLDADGNIAMAQPPYALAQDVASAIRTVLGEVWYNDTLGIPYFQQILGKRPPLPVLQAYMVQAALTVPNVVSAICIIDSVDRATRKVIGQVQFTDNLGNTGSVSL
jgi:hypothetical protein